MCRDWTFRVFFSGDYEFLCAMYGLSGASGKLGNNYYYKVLCTHQTAGRHNCLWCTIRNTELRIPLHVRGRSPARTLNSIKEDNKRFVEAGNDLKKAKDFNNAISEPFFDIPLDQVSCENKVELVST